MRIAFNVACHNCSFNSCFTVGADLESSPLETMLIHAHPRRRSKILELMNEHMVHASAYEDRIYRCRRCGQLRNSFWIRIAYDGGEIYETNCLCGNCRKAMESVDDHLQLNGQACPCCGEKQLRIADANSQGRLEISRSMAGERICRQTA